jgi:hypothetical protein
LKRGLSFIVLFTILFPLWGETVYSPTWGFRLDLPEGYGFFEGDGRDHFSFEGPLGARFDIAVYSGTYKNMDDLLADVNIRLKNRGEASFYKYREKPAALLELQFDKFSGWGLCLELGKAEEGKAAPFLLALAYGTGQDASLFHMSALDSIAPSKAETRYPGPIMEFAYPRGERKKTAVAGTGLEAWIWEKDAEAAQALVDREFALLRHYQFLENWQEAWIRFYRAIYRDSWDRLIDAAFQLERNWQPSISDKAGDRGLAQKALGWVQGFDYERDFEGSDFVNLVSAVTEGKGDCDSRAMLWAIILAQADIPAAIMVSREHGHAMGLADIGGQGARFEAAGKKWLVAETTAEVDIGLIAQEVSGIESWLAVVFE